MEYLCFYFEIKLTNFSLFDRVIGLFSPSFQLYSVTVYNKIKYQIHNRTLIVCKINHYLYIFLIKNKLRKYHQQL